MDSQSLPVIVAHRGYPKDHPENTVEACQAAVDAGAQWVEIDVQLHDGKLVLAHDLPLMGNETTLADFAAWLEATPQVSALVEMKQTSLTNHGIERVVAALIKTMRGNWHPISFNYDALQLAVASGSPRPGWVVCRYGSDVLEKAEAMNSKWLIINRTFMPPGPMPKAHCDWMAYEITSADQARDLLSRGVTWVETMSVSEVINGLSDGT